MKTCDAIWALEDCCKSMIFDGYGTLCSDDLREIAASYRKLAEREKALTEALEGQSDRTVSIAVPGDDAAAISAAGAAGRVSLVVTP